VGWALRPATVRNVATCADICNAGKTPQQIHGLNQNHNREMKEIFQCAKATRSFIFSSASST
jgi:hypothetical protein